MTLKLKKGGLVVSCQARADNPLHGAHFMGAMAFAARHGGACAIRANGVADVRAVKAAGLPVIGIDKQFSDAVPVYITPTLAACDALAEAGADIIGIDATPRPRQGDNPARLIRHITEALGLEAFCDIATPDEGAAAADMGATYVATTLSGYTDDTRRNDDLPDYALIEALVARLKTPVVAEGRFSTPERARRALDCGAYAVVVGTAITNPREITRGFVRQIEG
ncbi:MAG: N-acetylmannosamine-6-phosphate 2-epimerase [Martelella sp.]|uniref:N-acetylmannosamine-6-phosphate 2-epimerase n=1 Tax=unclassified Martelella TaxID=2629616 RepID=UPI000C477E6E|nr:N-acetylmannosamine-6-phosphate 2-epimerase [Martelella sp.]MAU19893.1 N-acetylmannosamine-6-phosphate 2-epimerase [Martelella sp.]